MKTVEEIWEENRKKDLAEGDEFMKKEVCPVCKKSGIVQYGGRGHFWFEHSCGSYSPVCETIKEAFDQWKSNPQQVDPELNSRMWPRVGG